MHSHSYFKTHLYYFPILLLVVYLQLNHSVHNLQWWVKFVLFKNIIRLVSYLLMLFVILQVELIIIFVLFYSCWFSYFTCSTCCNCSQFWNHKRYIETKVIDRQQKLVLVFVLFLVVKDILCTHNPLVLFCLLVMNCRN